MLFSVGVETPKDNAIAYGISVPALDNADYGCVSAGEPREIPVMAQEAILSVIEDMLVSGSYSVEDIVDDGFMFYAASPDYSHCDTWFVIDVDLTGFEGASSVVESLS
ncbi:type II toxin-antitoxin system HicB family antitoxin [Klebsiella sp. BIGb0407]|uniref:type II toxin-antitoxin system HicB family antitoxin n=1 Tax=Klebsiella sp. BIGb0407 TaxID=2940603 RepID=UPI00216A9D9F|nr:type II toxin-antitoxin system HicB family antitoxin [Klebsiella sp. BIGb0407]MCS3432109.1 hypothetical protein [Klebsiella sp. BIGb0407]